MAFGGSAETDLKALTQQWIDAYVKADTAFLKTVEADDWSFVDSDGKWQANLVANNQGKERQRLAG